MLGKYIKKIRESKGLSTKELSEKADVSNTYIFLLEKEKVDNPSIKVIKNIAEALEVPISELIDKC